jgi:hypothetical protein
LHSPNAFVETGLQDCPSEKSRDGGGFAAEQSILRSPVCLARIAEYGHYSLVSDKNEGISPQCRLHGGARSLALTRLRSNSLLTGKNTGNLRDFALENARFIL